MATVAEQIQQRRAELQANPTVREQLLRRLQENSAQPTLSEALQRQLTIGTQGSGRGIAGLLGMPVDLAQIALNGVSAGAEFAANKAGLDVETPRLSNSVGSSDWIAEHSGNAVETALGDVLIDQDDMTPSERTRYKINQFGTEAAAGSGLAKSIADYLPRALAAPYLAPGNAGRVLAGDTAAGVGSGAALSTYEEHAPDHVKETLGPFGELVAALGGGVTGAAALRGAEGAARLAKSPAGRTSLPEATVARDPDTYLPVSRNDFSKAAALYQRAATSPAAAAEKIEDYLKTVSGARPTSALLSDDPGLLVLERRQRVTDPAKFIEADKRVTDGVWEEVQSVRPAGADPSLPKKAAATRIGELKANAASRVSAAEANATAHNEVLESLIDSFDNASANKASRDLDRIVVDETYLPERGAKNALYEAAQNSQARIGRSEAAAAAAEALNDIDLAMPPLRDSRSQALAEGFAVDATGTRGVRGALTDRTALNNLEREARQLGEFGRADTSRAIRQGVERDLRAAAESGAPGSAELAQADRNYRERFAPYFRDGNVAPKFFRDIDRDGGRGSSLPEQTASKFLQAGASGRAAAEDLSQILSIAPNREQGTAAALEYLLADAASKGVIRKGKISETALARFISMREGVFSQLPELASEFDSLLKDVRAGNATSSDLADALKSAKDDARLTEQQIESGALRLIADRSPRKAAAAVLGAPDPVRAMREAVSQFSLDDAAARGWRAAVADQLADNVTVAAKAAVTSGYEAVSLARLSRAFEQNRAALAEVFSPEDMAALGQAQRRLEALSRRGAAAGAGSTTAENFGGLRGILRAFASPAGAYTLLTRGALMAGSVERRIKMVADQFPDGDAKAVKLIARAHFDPELAAHLLKFPVKDGQVYDWSKRLNQLLAVQEIGQEE